MADPMPVSLAVVRRRLPDAALDVAPQPTETVEAPEDVAKRRAAAMEFRRARWERRVPPLFRDASLADLTAQQNPGGRVSAWLDSDAQTLLLYSPTTGVGKTHAAYAVAGEAVRRGVWVEAWTSTELLTAMRPGGDSAAEDAAIRCGLLLIDDLGRESSEKDWPREKLQHIVNSRCIHGRARRIIVTTNLADDALSIRYGDPFVDRLVDRADLVHVKGESRRRPLRWGA